MSNLPPRKFSTGGKTSKQDASPLQILLQMGFPRHRALKALAATGNRSVQLASDWLLTHVNDVFIDTDAPREYILYACPTGSLLNQLNDFWDRSKTIGGWNGAHNFPPHITLVSFFKAPDESSLQLAKAIKYVVELVGAPPSVPLKLEPYLSQNFMGLFVSKEHADYFKRIAIQFVKEVSSETISLEPHVKSLHITLAYHFDVAAYDSLKNLVDELQPLDNSNWELRLYSRDPRFNTHQVHKVVQGYTPKENDELELVIGDYVYIDEKELGNSTDGWVQGTSWLTGVTGCLPAVYTRRTAESEAWTLHRAITLGANFSADKSDSEQSVESEMSTNYPHEDANKLGYEKSEETYAEWKKYWSVAKDHRYAGILDVTKGENINWKNGTQNGSNGDAKVMKDMTNDTKTVEKEDPRRRWFFALRHGERVDLTYGQWVPFCFDANGKYVRKDLNMPVTLGERAGGPESYRKDTPLTRVGRLQAQLVGEGLREAGVTVSHVYSSSALRSVETAHHFLEGLQADKSVKIRVDPGLFEGKMWHLAHGPLAPFMTPLELHKAGYNVDLDYKPYYPDLDLESSETMEEFFKRNATVMQSAAKDTEKEGGNVVYVGHAATLDVMVKVLKNYDYENGDCFVPELGADLLRVPYCAFGAMKNHPWQVVCPPCPPSINSSSGRFDWKYFYGE